MIKCKKCQEEKDEAAFTKDRSRPNGRSIHCRVCKNASQKNEYWLSDGKESARRRSERLKRQALGRAVRIDKGGRLLGATIDERLKYYRMVDPITGCWNWTLSTDPDGYGRFGAGTKKGLQVTKYAYTLWNGPIADGLSVLHRCDNRRCYNPDHLFLGTQQDNIADMIKKGRANMTGRRKVKGLGDTGTGNASSPPRCKS